MLRRAVPFGAAFLFAYSAVRMAYYSMSIIIPRFAI